MRVLHVYRQQQRACLYTRSAKKVHRTFTTMMNLTTIKISLLLLLFIGCVQLSRGIELKSENDVEPKLAKLVKFFSKPGAFNQTNEIFGEEQSSATASKTSLHSTTCPEGEEGLECRRAEARRSVDCPRGDCYCYNCSRAGAELWASCCRESLKCCSHLAAACRTCDQPQLYPFCAKHFKKCLSQLNDKKPMMSLSDHLHS